MQGIIKELNGVFPVTHLQAVYVDENNTLETYLNNRKVVSVKDFGAVGDGVTDDAPAIQATLNYLKETGGEIFFPAGTYLVKSSITFYSYQRLAFDKGATILRGLDTVNIVFVADGDDERGGYDGVCEVEFVGGTIDMNASLNSNAGAIAFIHARDLRVRNCTFKNLSGGWHYIECNGSTNVVIEQNIFKDVHTTATGAELIQIDGAWNNTVYPWAGKKDSTGCCEITIRNNQFEGNDFSPAIGNHTELDHERIYIYNNLFKNFGHEASSQSGHRGVIAFTASTKQVFVFNNQFVNFAKAVIKTGSQPLDCHVFNNILINCTYATYAGCTFTNNFIAKKGEVAKFASSGVATS